MENVLGRRVLRSVRLFSPQAPAMKTLVADAFAEGSNLLDAGQSGKDAFNHILCALRRDSIRASPASAMQIPSNTAVAQGKFLVPRRIMAVDIEWWCVGARRWDYATRQQDEHQCSVHPSAHFSAGKNMRPVPFSDGDKLPSTLDDSSLNKTPARLSSCLNGGSEPMTTRAMTCAQGVHMINFS